MGCRFAGVRLDDPIASPLAPFSASRPVEGSPISREVGALISARGPTFAGLAQIVRGQEVVDRVAQEVKVKHGQGDGSPEEDGHPPCDPDKALGVVDQVAQADHVRAPEPEEAQSRLQQNHAGRGKDVGQQLLEEYPGVRGTSILKC